MTGQNFVTEAIYFGSKVLTCGFCFLFPVEDFVNVPSGWPSVALDVAEWRETQQSQASMEHFTDGPQQLQACKHLPKEVWPRLLKEKVPTGLILCFSCLYSVPFYTSHVPPFAGCSPLGCVPGCSMN